MGVAGILTPMDGVILVVEDDRSIRDITRIGLTDVGFSVVTAADGDEALAAFRRHGPDAVVLDVMLPKRDGLEVLRTIPRPGLILLDLMMPVMTGWELLERLSNTDELADIPVVVVSAVSKREEPGAIRVIPKWIESNALLTHVEEFCG